MLHVCICDDDPGDAAQVQALAESFARRCSEFSLSVETFSSACDLLERLEVNGSFDLYLLDILMPHMGGHRAGSVHSDAARGVGDHIFDHLPGVCSGRFRCGGLRVSDQASGAGKI